MQEKINEVKSTVDFMKWKLQTKRDQDAKRKCIIQKQSGCQMSDYCSYVIDKPKGCKSSIEQLKSSFIKNESKDIMDPKFHIMNESKERFYGFNRDTRKISKSYHKLLNDPMIREDIIYSSSYETDNSSSTSTTKTQSDHSSIKTTTSTQKPNDIDKNKLKHNGRLGINDRLKIWWFRNIVVAFSSNKSTNSKDGKNQDSSKLSHQEKGLKKLLAARNNSAKTKSKPKRKLNATDIVLIFFLVILAILILFRIIFTPKDSQNRPDWMRHLQKLLLGITCIACFTKCSQDFDTFISFMITAIGTNLSSGYYAYLMECIDISKSDDSKTNCSTTSTTLFIYCDIFFSILTLIGILITILLFLTKFQLQKSTT